MIAGSGQMNHSAAGPSLRTIEMPAIPSAIPNRNRMSSAGTMATP